MTPPIAPPTTHETELGKPSERIHELFGVSEFERNGNEFGAQLCQSSRLGGIRSASESAHAIASASAFEQRAGDAATLLAERADYGNEWFAIR